MAIRYQMNILESKAPYWEGKIFDISFEESIMGVTSSTFDLRRFQREGYLAELIRLLKTADETCFMVIEISIATLDGMPEEKRERALQLTTNPTTIAATKAVKKMFGIRKGMTLDFFSLPDNKLYKLTEILNCMDSENTRCYFIFDKEANRQALLSRIENFHKTRALDEEHVASLSLDFIKYCFGGKGVEEKFKIFTSRCDREEAKNIMLNSTFADADKFKVKVR